MILFEPITCCKFSRTLIVAINSEIILMNKLVRLSRWNKSVVIAH